MEARHASRAAPEQAAMAGSDPVVGKRVAGEAARVELFAARRFAACARRRARSKGKSDSERSVPHG